MPSKREGKGETVTGEPQADATWIVLVRLSADDAGGPGQSQN